MAGWIRLRLASSALVDLHHHHSPYLLVALLCYADTAVLGMCLSAAVPPRAARGLPPPLAPNHARFQAMRLDDARKSLQYGCRHISECVGTDAP